ncbi:MAG: NADP-dependent malic enzyme [Spirochaetales bacterium]
MAAKKQSSGGGSVRVTDREALDYHEEPPAGKIEVVPTKPLTSQYDLALAYSPGVAAASKAIAQRADDAYRYTSKGNLIGVISNGTAVLGLGQIGATASKPVMEGKVVLFKRFAGIDGFDLEVDETDPDRFIDIVAALESTFGGINLEDIRAPECFYIERELKRRCRIPVMHDDQHGTAIITGAALLNAIHLARKDVSTIRCVVIGAGAAGLACTRFYESLGVRRSNIVMVDVNGVIRRDTVGDDHPARDFATERPLSSLDEALENADVVLGVSVGGLLKPEHLKSMARDPIVFALANPEPEIDYPTAMATRSDLLMATGRSDFPNQVNNVLGFPYIFRGALDVHATEINEEMKIAAARALARIAREPVPETVGRAYSASDLSFGRGYLIPKPLDPRLLTRVAPAVAKAAMDSGAARRHTHDWQGYEVELLERVGIGQKLITGVLNRARKNPKRVIFAEADEYNVLKAAELAADQGIAAPILLGRKRTIRRMIEQHELQSLSDAPILDPHREERRVEEYAEKLYLKRRRKGVTRTEARRMIVDRNYFGMVMLENGDADAFISGMTREYPSVVRPALQIIAPEEGVNRVAGMYIVNSPKGAYFFSDTTVNLNPDVDDLVDIIGLTARTVRFFDVEPVVACLSYSNFGSTRTTQSEKVALAVERAKKVYPELIIDGEVQANVALNDHLMNENYPFSELAEKRVNTLVFPDLASGNIAYKLVGEIGGAELLGPILMGMRKPVHVLQLGSSVREIVNMVALAVVEAQRVERSSITVREEFGEHS